MTTDRTVLLRRGGCSVLIAAGPAQPWCVVHWGSDLGDLDDQAQTAVVAVTARPVPPSSLDRAVRVGLVPEAARGWTGRPGLSGHPAGAAPAPAPLLRPAGCDVALDTPTATCHLHSGADQLEVRLTSTVELGPEGVVRVRHELVNRGERAYVVDALLPCLPLAGPATEVLDLTGRWCRERSPQRRLLHQGAWVRDSRLAARPHRPRRDPADGGRHAGFRVRPRRGVGHARRVEWRPHRLGGAAANRRGSARRRRAARAK